MREEDGKLVFENARLVVDKREPKELVDLYLEVEDFRKLCSLVNSNRVTVALRIKRIG